MCPSEHPIDRTICENFERNNNEKDIKQTLRYTRLLLTFIGIWPMITSHSSKRWKCYSIFAIPACFFIVVFTFIPAALHTIFREKNPLIKVMLLGPVGASFGVVLKYFIIILRANTIKECLEIMKNDWFNIESEKECAIMRRNALIGRGITIVCSLFLYTGGMSYHTIMPMFKGARINALNVTIRPLVYPGYDIFVNSQLTPTYEIIFFLTCLSGFVRYTITIAICNLAAVFVSHVCGQAEIVMSRLNMIFDDLIINEGTNLKIIEKRISSIVRWHVRGLRLASKIDEAMREIFLIEVVAATTIICLLEYYCMTEWNNSELVAIITYFILLTSYVFNIFILCHIGELLNGQFYKIGKVAYMIDWHRLPCKSGRAVVLIIIISNYSSKLTAGRMMEFSMSSFGIIMKTSVMYLNMLRAITA